MKIITTSKVPEVVAKYAGEIAQREYLRPSDVVRSLMLRGMLARQLDRGQAAAKCRAFSVKRLSTNKRARWTSPGMASLLL